MAPSRSRASDNDTDASMIDAPEATRLPGNEMVNSPCYPPEYERISVAIDLRQDFRASTDTPIQDVDETPDYTDSDTNPNTTASSVIGDPNPDSRKRRSEANQLRRSIFGKKHDVLGETKVRHFPDRYRGRISLSPNQLLTTTNL